MGSDLLVNPKSKDSVAKVMALDRCSYCDMAFDVGLEDGAYQQDIF